VNSILPGSGGGIKAETIVLEMMRGQATGRLAAFLVAGALGPWSFQPDWAASESPAGGTSPRSASGEPSRPDTQATPAGGPGATDFGHELFVLFSGLLSGGRVRTIEIPIDPTVSTFKISLICIPDGVEFEARLVDPRGRGGPLERNRNSEWGMPLSLYPERPSAGLWTVEIRATSDLRCQLEVWGASNLRVEAASSRKEAALGESVKIAATVEVNDKPFSGAQVEARLRRLGDEDEEAESRGTPLPEVGAGRYEGVLDTSVAGVFTIIGVARGTISGYAFERGFAVDHLDVIPETVRLLGAVSANPMDTNGNGLYDNLTVELDVELLHAGRYLIGADLNDEEGSSVAGSPTLLNLGAGRRTIRLVFPGKEIVKQGRDGPYRLSKVFVSDLDGTPDPKIVWENLLTTGPLKHDQFE